MDSRPKEGQVAPRATMMAILPNGKEIVHSLKANGFHGTAHFAPGQAFRTGIPAKGVDRRLLEHVRGNQESAFRGTTAKPVISSHGQGATFWAEVGGWVYEVESVPSWDVEKELEGRVPQPGGLFGDCPTKAELERAIAARIENHVLIRAGVVVAGRVVDGELMLKVGEWKLNPTR